MTATMGIADAGALGVTVEELDRIQREYPQLAPFLQIPEVGALIIRGALAEPPWDGTTLMNEIRETNYWQTTPLAERSLFIDRVEDPATVQQALDEQYRVATDIASQLGITIQYDDLPVMAGLVESAYMEQWTPQRWAEAIAESFFPEDNADFSGQIGDTYRDVSSLAEQYALPMGEKKKRRLTRGLLTGAMNRDGIEADLAKIAAGKYRGLADQILSGQTVREAADSHIQIAAQLLEIDADEIDLTKPMWSAPLNVKVGKDDYDVMSLSDWQTQIMQDRRYGWDKTNNAKRGAIEVANAIRETFGLEAI